MPNRTSLLLGVAVHAADIQDAAASVIWCGT
jgi:hypothetical protein